MIDDQFSTETAPAPAPGPWWKTRAALIGGALVIAAAGTGIGLAATGGSGTVTIHGSINLGFVAADDTTNPGASIAGSNLIKAGDACDASDGYTDVGQGAAVTIGGTTGQIGVGALSAGTETAGGYCQFTFSVPVPGGQSAYTVTVSHRGTQTLTADEVRNGIVLTLGD